MLVFVWKKSPVCTQADIQTSHSIVFTLYLFLALHIQQTNTDMLYCQLVKTEK